MGGHFVGSHIRAACLSRTCPRIGANQGRVGARRECPPRGESSFTGIECRWRLDPLADDGSGVPAGHTLPAPCLGFLAGWYPVADHWRVLSG